MSIATTNPATGETVRAFSPHTDAQVEEKLARASAAFERWRRTPFAERATVLGRTADLLEKRKEELGRLMTVEMGKLRKQAIAEIEKCATGCRNYAEHAARYRADEPVQTDAKRSFVRFQPIGAVLAVMPWNFPYWQVFRFAAPALMAGNVGLLKHASNVPQCALALEDLFRRAGAPPGVFQTLLVPSSAVERLLADPRIAAAGTGGYVVSHHDDLKSGCGATACGSTSRSARRSSANTACRT